MLLVLFSQDGDTPLHWASARSQTAVVSLLLDHGADVHAKGFVSICSDIVLHLSVTTL